MQENVIFHVDVNSAFLSWTSVKRLKEDPAALDLRTVPSAVGGDVETRHGVITAKSIPAKKYGVKTGEPVVKALRKCPGLILVKSDFKTYRAYSRAFIAILRKYTDQIQQVSIDEAYMDVTALLPAGCDPQRHPYTPQALAGKPLPWPLNLAEKIKDEIRDTLGFTVNVGISSNKLLAKMASDFEKPDRIHTLYPEEIQEKMWPLPVSDLYGCGPASASRLTSLGIRTIGDLAGLNIDFLLSEFGDKGGTYLHESANGRGNPYVNAVRAEAKGYSNETTTSFDIDESNYELDMPGILDSLAESVALRLQQDHVYASTIGVMAKTDDFRRHSRQTTLDVSTNSAVEMQKVSAALMRQLVYGKDGLFTRGKKLRLVGVSATKLDKGQFRQISLTDWMQTAENEAQKKQEKKKQLEIAKRQEERRQKLDWMMRKIRRQYGENAVSKGAEDLQNKKGPSID